MVCFISSCDVSAAVPYPNEIGQGTYTEMPWTFFFFLWYAAPYCGVFAVTPTYTIYLAAYHRIIEKTGSLRANRIVVFEGCRTANPTKYTRVFLSGTTKKIQILPLEELRPPRGTLPGVAGEREKKKKIPDQLIRYWSRLSWMNECHIPGMRSLLLALTGPRASELLPIS